MAKKINKKLIIYIWLSLLVLGLLAYLFFPKTFSLSALISLIQDNYWLAISLYFLIICFRGLLLISPLSVTLAGTVFFPPLTVFLINTFGILISSTLIYKFSEYLGFDRYFENKYQARLDKLKARLDKKEIPIILAWSFLPLFPTDLITYLSATLKIKIWKCLLGIFIGTAVINAIFIYSLNFFLPTTPNIKTSLVVDSLTLNSNAPLPADPSQTVATTSPLNLSLLTPPLSEARSRVTKKPFGLKVSPTNSPVQPEKFSGYHTGVDFEILPGEADQPVAVAAVCSGPMLLKKYASGYGGVAVQECSLNKKTVTIIYGHLKLASISPASGAKLKAGEKFALLGQGYSPETDGERKHLHLGIHLGSSINILGYVSRSSDLSAWLNALDYLP